MARSRKRSRTDLGGSHFATAAGGPSVMERMDSRLGRGWTALPSRADKILSRARMRAETLVLVASRKKVRVQLGLPALDTRPTQLSGGAGVWVAFSKSGSEWTRPSGPQE